MWFAGIRFDRPVSFGSLAARRQGAFAGTLVFVIDIGTRTSNLRELQLSVVGLFAKLLELSELTGNTARLLGFLLGDPTSFAFLSAPKPAKVTKRNEIA
jgi:hypothetical protein